MTDPDRGPAWRPLFQEASWLSRTIEAAIVLVPLACVLAGVLWPRP
jgi:hypothetical protein